MYVRMFMCCVLSLRSKISLSIHGNLVTLVRQAGLRCLRFLLTSLLHSGHGCA